MYKCEQCQVEFSTPEGINRHQAMAHVTEPSVMPSADSGPTRQAAIKYDDGKAPIGLVSTLWIVGVSEVLGFGAKKYAANNWRKGFNTVRLLSAALRHIFAFLGGEDLDPESGLCHLDHASCMLMFASELWRTRKDLDDRYKG